MGAAIRNHFVVWLCPIDMACLSSGLGFRLRSVPCETATDFRDCTMIARIQFEKLHGKSHRSHMVRKWNRKTYSKRWHILPTQTFLIEPGG